MLHFIPVLPLITQCKNISSSPAIALCQSCLILRYSQQTDFSEHQCIAPRGPGGFLFPEENFRFQVHTLSFVAIFFNDYCTAPLLVPQGSVPALCSVPRLMPSSSVLPGCWHPSAVGVGLTLLESPPRLPQSRMIYFFRFPSVLNTGKLNCSCH